MPESSEVVTNGQRGALTEAVYYILLSLHTPMHGYAIMQNITNLTRGRITLGAGTLYGAINTLLDKGWIAHAADNTSARKKEYLITDTGRLMVQNELNRLAELLTNGNNITRGNHHADNH